VTAINVQEGAEVAKDDILIGLSGDDLTESIQSASESLRSAEISMQNLQDAMNNYTITAPINGTIIEKDAKAGDAAKAGDTLCIVYDLSYLEMSINVDELQISSISVGQKVQITADAVQDKTYVGTVTRVSMKGTANGGTTTLSRHHPHRRYRRSAPRHERQRRDRGGRGHQRPLRAQRSGDAGRLCPRHAGFPQRFQRRAGDGSPGGLRLRRR